MKTYYVDTNIFLRYLLFDNLKQARLSEGYFQNAKKGKIKLVVLSEVIPEINYVLIKVYKEKKENVVSWLESIVKTDYLEVEQRQAWMKALEVYSEVKSDIVDAFLFVKSELNDAEVLSFDKDFKKLGKLKS